MSRITLVVFVAYTLMAPFVPAGTMAALALMRPSREFRVATPGRDSPVGQTVRWPSGPDGTTETFSEYAAAVVGMLQLPSCGIGKLWKVPPRIGPLPPFCGRVSTKRQGRTGTNCSCGEEDGVPRKPCSNPPGR